MTPDALGEAHDKVIKALTSAGRPRPPGLQAVHAAVVSTCDFDAASAEAFMGQPWGKQGWLRFRSKVWPAEKATEDLMSVLGPPIAGEWVEGETSWRLMAHPGMPGLGMLIAVRELSAEEFGALDSRSLIATAGLRQDVHVLAAGAGNDPRRQRLHYRVYFRVGQEGAVVRAFDAFRGFAG